MQTHRVVSRDEWIDARKKLLIKEKEFTRLRDQLNQQRRDLPWVAVHKQYIFEGTNGKQSLSELFDGKNQLVVYHFMFAPNADAGCMHCSFWADSINGITAHLKHRDVTMLAISRAPIEKLEAFKKRMGWTFKWVSSGNTDFNYDFNVSFTEEELENKEAFYNFTTQNPGRADREGVSVFYKNDKGDIFHTYSSYARGIDMLNAAYMYLDLVPMGRQDELGLRHHDKYD